MKRALAVLILWLGLLIWATILHDTLAIVISAIFVNITFTLVLIRYRMDK
jgi:hypothetical protein